MKYGVYTTKYHIRAGKLDGNSPFAMPSNRQAAPVGSFLNGMLLTAHLLYDYLSFISMIHYII